MNDIFSQVNTVHESIQRQTLITDTFTDNKHDRHLDSHEMRLTTEENAASVISYVI